MLSATNAQAIWERYKATKDTNLRQQLILQYAPLVKYVVGRMAIGLPGVLDSEDMISHATIGLIDAIERFDPDKGLKFETYAIPRIRGSVLDVIRRLGNYPRGARRKMKEIEAANAALEEQNGRPPADEEVAEYLGISVEDYHRDLLDTNFAIVPLDRVLKSSGDDDFLSLSEVIEDTRNPSPAVAAERAELRAALFSAINELSDRERTLLALYYYEELTLKEISQIFEISESRVCQLHAKAILRLRRSLANAGMMAGVS